MDPKPDDDFTFPNTTTARALLLDAISRAREALTVLDAVAGRNRESALVATKLDEAELWASRLPTG